MDQQPAFKPSKAQIRRALALVLLLTLIAMLVPAFALPALGYGPVASFVGLAGLGGLFATLTFGLRGGLVAALALAIGATLLTLTSNTWWGAAVVMSLVALVFGFSARWGGQGAFVSSAIALSFVASDGAKALPSLDLDAVVLGVAFLVWAAAISGLTHLFLRKPILQPNPQPQRLVLSYMLMLTFVTFTTQSLAIALDMGHVGAWLVMTPFIVIMPSIHDGLRKSLLRAAGTAVGFIFVMVVALVTTSHPLLYLVGTLMFTAAIYSKIRKWNYFYYALFLTPAIVLLEGISTSVTTEAEGRLVATLGAIAISLAAMGILELVNRRTTSVKG